MNSLVQLEIRKLGFFGVVFRIVFYVFNVIMLVVLISVFRSMPDTGPQTSAEQVGTAIGMGIGTGLYLIVWAAGAVILGLPVLMTRGQKMLAPIDAPEAVAYRRRQWMTRGALTVLGLVLFFAYQQSDRPGKATAPFSPAPTSTIPDATASKSPRIDAILRGEQPPKATPDEQTQHPEMFVKIEKFSWTKDAFDTVMMANFTLKNDLPWPVKDITIRCEHAAPSGTTIDQNTRTIYERLEPGTTKQIRSFNMGFVHSQATKSGCAVTKVVILR